MRSSSGAEVVDRGDGPPPSVRSRAAVLLDIARSLADARREDEIVDIIVGSVFDSVGASSGAAYFVVEPGRLVLAAMRGGSDQPVREMPLELDLPVPECVRTGEAVFVESPEALAGRYPLVPELASAPAAHRQSIVCLPLRSGRAVVGAFAFGFDRPHGFDEEDRAFFLTIKSHASVAVERSRLREADRAARNRLEIIARVSRRFAETILEVPVAAGIVAQEISTALDCTCAVNLVTRAGDALELVSICDPDAERLASVRATLDRRPIRLDEDSWPARVFRSGTTAFVREVDLEALCAVTPREEYREHLLRFPLRSLALLPLRASGETLGVVTISTPLAHAPLCGEDEAMLTELVDRGAMAIQSAELHERARRAIREREELIAVVSHDLRNPLGSLKLGLDSMSAGAGGGGARRVPSERLLVAMRHAVERMDRLVESLMTLAVIDAGKLQLAMTPVDVRDLLTEVASAHEPLAGERGLVVAVEAAGAGGVRGSRDLLLQVFGNLIGNAIKFTPVGGRIALRAHRAGAEVVLEVADTGPGIAAEDVARIFDRYWQAGHGRGHGLGLGLSIAQGIVQAHGGRIWAESEEGRGTRVFVALAAA